MVGLEQVPVLPQPVMPDEIIGLKFLYVVCKYNSFYDKARLIQERLAALPQDHTARAQSAADLLQKSLEAKHERLTGSELWHEFARLFGLDPALAMPLLLLRHLIEILGLASELMDLVNVLHAEFYYKFMKKFPSVATALREAKAQLSAFKEILVQVIVLVLLYSCACTDSSSASPPTPLSQMSPPEETPGILAGGVKHGGGYRRRQPTPSGRWMKV
jgi:hypothetical protein